MARRMRQNYANNFANSAERRAEAWYCAENLGELTDDALVTSEIMAGQSTFVQRKSGGGSSRAHMARVATQAFERAEARVDMRSAETATQKGLIL